MNENEQLEVHYMDNGYSYPVSEGFVDFFGGAPIAPLNYLSLGQMHDQVKFCVASQSLIVENELCRNWYKIWFVWGG